MIDVGQVVELRVAQLGDRSEEALPARFDAESLEALHEPRTILATYLTDRDLRSVSKLEAGVHEASIPLSSAESHAPSPLAAISGSASAPAMDRYAWRLNGMPTWLPGISTLRASGIKHDCHRTTPSPLEADRGRHGAGECLCEPARTAVGIHPRWATRSLVLRR